MEKKQILIKKTTKIIEETLYEVEMPKSMDKKDIKKYLTTQHPKLTIIKDTQPKKMEEELNIEEVINQGEEPADTNNLGSSEVTHNTVIKNNLNAAILKKDFIQFERYFLNNKQHLESNEHYLLLHKSLLNNELFDFALFLLSHNEDFLTQRQITRFLPNVGIVNDRSILEKYISLGYHKLDINGKTLEELYREAEFIHLLGLFN